MSRQLIVPYLGIVDANGKRHVQASAPHHPRASSSGCVYQHVLVAERALGHLLPRGAQVHHVDGDKRNNTNRNLVICQDIGYHKLLHYRARIINLGGDPNTQKFCSDCDRMLPLDDFAHNTANKSSGKQSICRGCCHDRDALRRRAGVA